MEFEIKKFMVSVFNEKGEKIRTIYYDRYCDAVIRVKYESCCPNVDHATLRRWLEGEAYEWFIDENWELVFKKDEWKIKPQYEIDEVIKAVNIPPLDLNTKVTSTMHIPGSVPLPFIKEEKEEKEEIDYSYYNDRMSKALDVMLVVFIVILIVIIVVAAYLGLQLLGVI